MYAENFEVTGLELVREDMGLEEGELLLMDGEYYTADEVATLNQEVTPEIEAVLIQALYSHCMVEYTEYMNSDRHFALIDGVDEEVVVDKVLMVQELMTRGLNYIKDLDKQISAV